MSRRSQRIEKLVALQDQQDRLVLPAPSAAVRPTVDGQSPRVYLAGKIEKYCWRHTIFGIRDSSEDDPTAEVDGFAYAGPYFTSCDHGCYHGRNEHGVGASSGGCEGGDVQCSPDEVLARCLRYIAGCDVVFAYLDGDKPYGTIFEMGIASALGKPVYLAYGLSLGDLTGSARQVFADTGGVTQIPRYREQSEMLWLLVEDTWLAAEASDGRRVFGSAVEAWRAFVRWYRAIARSPRPMIGGQP